MVHKSPFRLVAASGLLTVLGILFLVAVVRLFGDSSDEHWQPGETVEYHPPATQARTAVDTMIEDWKPDRAAGQAIFVPRIEAGKSLGIETRLSHQKFGDDVETVHAAVAIRASEKSLGPATPLRIALVIDRSGSMIGAKLDRAVEAGHALVDSMKPRDSLAIISYGSDVVVHAEMQRVNSDSREALHEALARLYADGGTNLSGGWEAGLRALQPADPEAINRILVFSDGRANEGIVEPNELARLASDALETSRVSTTSMGVGLDYDETLMNTMATSGAGNYYFIEDANQVAATLDQEFQGLMSTVARSTTLRLRVPDGVEIVSVQGFAFRQISDEEYAVDLDAFFADQQKDLLIELRIEGLPRGSTKLLSTSLEYVDVSTARPDAIVADHAVTITSGSFAVDEVVLKRVQQIRTAQAFIDAMDIYDGGDRAEAAAILRAQRKANRSFLTQYDIEDPAFERVDGTLEQLAEDVEKTERHTTKGKWMRKYHYSNANKAVTSSVVF